MRKRWFLHQILIPLVLAFGAVAVSAQTGQTEPTGPPAPPRKTIRGSSVPPVRLSPPERSGSTNNASSKARHLVPDATWESDTIDSVNTEAWYSFPAYYEHTYAIETYVPYTYNNSSYPSLDIAVFEADGTTDITPGVDEFGLQPSLDELGFNGGDRRTYSNFFSNRFVHVRVMSCCGGDAGAGEYFDIRVVDLTQAAARWTVNGYNAYFALNNSSADTVQGYIDYFDQSGNLAGFDSFNIPGHGAVQLVRPANVTIGGVLFGGVRVIPTSGGPGTITAQEYVFNPGVKQYLNFIFNPAPWQTTGGTRF